MGNIEKSRILVEIFLFLIYNRENILIWIFFAGFGGMGLKKIIVISEILFVLIAFSCFCFDFNSYNRQFKTVSCDENGIIFSITTFDGENETEPFVKSLGHAWLSVDNRSGHSVYIKDYEIKNNETVTLSVWAISEIAGVFFNLESNFVSKCNRYVGRQSLSVNIEESQLKAIEQYIDKNNNWAIIKNCTFWSIQLWNEIVDDEFKLKTQTLVYTPKRLEKAFSEFDCIEVDKDFSRCGEVFFYQNGIRTELQLCS